MNHEEYKAKAFTKDPELYEEYKALEPRYKLISDIIKLSMKKTIKDPFYSDANQRYLEMAAEEIKKGVNLVHHDIIED